MWSDWTNVMGSLNWWAILVAALATMVVGSVWYAKGVMGTQWGKLSGVKFEDMKGSDAAPVMIGTFVITLISAWGLALLEVLLAVDGWWSGFTFGLFIGLVFVSTGWLVNTLYEKKPLMLWKINAGYATLALAVMAGVLAAWPK